MKRPFLALVTLLFTTTVLAETQPPALDATEQARVVDAAATMLEKAYVFPDVAQQMAALIRKNLAAGQYSGITGGPEFAQRLTADLRSVSRDRHLSVVFDPERVRELRNPTDRDSANAEEERRRLQRMANYSFRKVEILPGNVGYLKFDNFADADGAFKVAVGAMAFLANCDALIVDLRENGGGSPQMIQVLTSYLFEGEPRHLNSFYYRADDTIEQTWTLPYVPGTRMPHAAVYVLTSTFTFSGAEEFTYNLKNLKRATIVGETTGGGAHPVRPEVLTDSFVMRVPFARAVNPVSKTNWEGTGVEPDVKVPAAAALDTAQKLALETLLAKEPAPRIKGAYQWALDGLSARLSPVTVGPDVLRSYAGTYGPRVITFEDGALYYRRNPGQAMRMIPMTEDIFRFDEVPYFRLKVVKKAGAIVGLEGIYDNGTTDFSPVTK